MRAIRLQDGESQMDKLFLALQQNLWVKSDVFGHEAPMVDSSFTGAGRNKKGLTQE